MAESIFSRLVRNIRRRLGLIQIVRIYMYVVRISGEVIPPEGTQKKKTYKRESLIQWELSFEEEPYFRTITPDLRLAEQRFKTEIEELVKAQETKVAQMGVRKSPFRWFETIPREAASQRQIDDFMKVATKEDQENFEKTGQINIAARPNFSITTEVNFEPADMKPNYFDVDSDRLKMMRSIDSFIFKVFRPNEEESYDSWGGELEHEL